MRTLQLPIYAFMMDIEPLRASRLSPAHITNVLLTLLGLILLASACGLGYYWSANQLDAKPLNIASRYFAAHQDRILNKRYLVVVDFTKPSFAKRMHIVDRQFGTIRSYLVAHGSAQQNGSLFVPSISNQPDSHASSAGFMLTAEHYVGANGNSLRLDGLESRNSNVRSRAIVIHSAAWVSERAIRYNLADHFVPRIGESYGCLAVSPQDINEVIAQLGQGALVYVHVEGQ